MRDGLLLIARPIAGSSDPNHRLAAWRGYWRIPKTVGPELREGLVRLRLL